MCANRLPVLRGSTQVPLEGLLGQRVAVIGYGNQGKSHALNLRDSGIDVVVGARNPAAASEDGFLTMPIKEASASALVIIALPDEVQGLVFEAEIRDHLLPDATIGFMHGFAIHYKHIIPPDGIGVVLVAPKGPGQTVRQRYLEGFGVPSLLAVAQESRTGTARSKALGWAAGIGSAHSGVIESTFSDETETDLFGEQAIIVGGLATLVKAAYETLVQAGYPPQLAYIECCHEVKQVADILHEQGMSAMMDAISTTAEMGAYHAMDVLDDEHLRSHLRTLLADIQDGTFAERLVNHKIKSQRRSLEEHDLEQTGKEIRSLMRGRTD